MDVEKSVSRSLIILDVQPRARQPKDRGMITHRGEEPIDLSLHGLRLTDVHIKKVKG